MCRISMMLTIVALLCASVVAAAQAVGIQDEVSLLQVHQQNADVKQIPAFGYNTYGETALGRATTSAVGAAKTANDAAQTFVETKVSDEKSVSATAEVAKFAANSAARVKRKASTKVASATGKVESGRTKNNQALAAKAAATIVKTNAEAAEVLTTAANVAALSSQTASGTNAANAAAAALAAKGTAATAKATMQQTVDTKNYAQSVSTAGVANTAATTQAQGALVSRVLSDYDAYLKKNANADNKVASVNLKDASKNQTNANRIDRQAQGAAAKASSQNTMSQKEIAKMVAQYTACAAGAQTSLVGECACVSTEPATMAVAICTKPQTTLGTECIVTPSTAACPNVCQAGEAAPAATSVHNLGGCNCGTGAAGVCAAGKICTIAADGTGSCA